MCIESNLIGYVLPNTFCVMIYSNSMTVYISPNALSITSRSDILHLLNHQTLMYWFRCLQYVVANQCCLHMYSVHRRYFLLSLLLLWYFYINLNSTSMAQLEVVIAVCRYKVDPKPVPCQADEVYDISIDTTSNPEALNSSSISIPSFRTIDAYLRLWNGLSLYY